MDSLISSINNHPYILASVLVGLQWVVSAAVDSMPEPMPDGSPSYQFWYKFLHQIAGNLKTARGARTQAKE